MIQQWDFPVDEPVSLPEHRRRRVDEAILHIAGRLQTGTSIRSLAAEYGVSREAIRRALARTDIALDVNNSTSTRRSGPARRSHARVPIGSLAVAVPAR